MNAEPETTTELPSAIVQGAPLDTWPTDLYVPPDALQVFLEQFEGPLDLLLYLIQRHNFDIIDIPIAEITRQYVQYIELMKQMNLDLAAEYLVMAAMLMEIKSRILLPVVSPDNTSTDDPRTQLIKQLQEYAQYKQAAQNLAALPQEGQDFFTATVELPELPKEIKIPSITWLELLEAMRDVMERAALFTSHQVIREPLSVRERMSLILERLKAARRVGFLTLFTLEEGRAGVVVTLLAILELARESLIQIVQQQPFEVLQVVSLETE